MSNIEGKVNIEENKEAIDLLGKISKMIKETKIIHSAKDLQEIEEISEIKKRGFGISERGVLAGASTGDFVAVRPVKGDKTYLGIYIGEVVIDGFLSYNSGDKVLSVSGHKNPMIYIPALKKNVFGASSWWSKIESEEDLKDITTDDLKNTWYVKALQELWKK